MWWILFALFVALALTGWLLWRYGPRLLSGG